MDSTPLPEPTLQPLSLKPTSSSSSPSPSPSASKLPIKRKTPHLQSPNTNLLSPKLESTATTTITTVDFDSKPPPFKFHRIWTEPDEIRFLQGLLDSSSDGLSFPRDLPTFYDRFSNSMSQPYTKSQLSEKLRRLRKKFRVISSRLARGLNPCLLSPHDRALFDLSNKLWSPEFASISPFAGNNKSISNDNAKGKSTDVNLVGVTVSFSPVLPVTSASNDDNDNDNNGMNDLEPLDLDLDAFDGGNVVKLSGVDVGCDIVTATARESELGRVSGSGGLAKSVAKSVLDVFDESLKEVRMVLAKERLVCLDNSKDGKEKDFQRRWREQRVAELDVFARRLRLVLDNSLNRQ